MNDVNATFDQYLELVQKTFGTDSITESPTATSAELKSLTDKYGEVPDQLLDLLKRRNGDNQTELVPPFRLKPCSHIVMAFESNRRCWDEIDDVVGSEGWAAAYPSGAVKLDQSWRKNWVPIADCEGDDVFIDMDPGSKGTKGQIVFAISDGMSMRVQAPSLADWLKTAHDYLAANPEEFSLSSCFD
jgi:cell wall assembly regulator SMI1